METSTKTKIDLASFPWDSPVTLAPIPNSNMMRIDIHHPSVNNDVPWGINSVSEQYQLVPNLVAVQTIEDVLHRAKLEFNVQNTIWSGRRLLRTYTIPGASAEIIVGDPILLSIDLINSYDGASVFGFNLNMIRLVCSNGMKTSFRLGSYRFKHVGGNGKWEEELSDHAKVIIGKTVNFREILPIYRKMVQIRMNESYLVRVIQEIVNKQEIRFPRTSVFQVLQQIDAQSSITLWDFYNAVTQILSADESFSTVKVNEGFNQYLFQEISREYPEVWSAPEFQEPIRLN